MGSQTSANSGANYLQLSVVLGANYLRMGANYLRRACNHRVAGANYLRVAEVPPGPENGGLVDKRVSEPTISASLIPLVQKLVLKTVRQYGNL